MRERTHENGEWCSAPASDQTEVMILGTVHMRWSELDDVLGPKRQSELQTVTDRLAQWRPNGVALERPQQLQHETDALYGEYRSGNRAYDEEFDTESTHPLTDDTFSICRGEYVQLGFRLADQLDHERVHAIDSPMYMGAHMDEKLLEEEYAEAQDAAATELDVTLPEGHSERLVKQWHESALSAFYHWLHHEENLRSNEQSQTAVALAGFESRYTGATMLTGWYERNLRIMENVYRAARDASLDRLLLVIGEGHVHILRQLLSNAPPLCPVNPQPFLTE